MQHVSFIGQPAMLFVKIQILQSTNIRQDKDGDRLTLDELRECRDSRLIHILKRFHSKIGNREQDYFRTIAAFLRARYL